MLHDKETSKTETGFKRVAENLYRAENGRYYALVKKGGKQIKKSLKTKDRKLAEARLDDFLKKVQRINPASEYKDILFEDLAALWLKSIEHTMKPSSFERREVAVKALTPYYRGVQIRSVGLKHIEAWKAGRGPLVEARTWNIELGTLRLVMGYAEKSLRIISENPTADLELKTAPKKKVRIPSRAELERIIHELRHGHRSTGEAADLMEFLAYSGCRIEEAVQLQWGHIDLTRKTMLVTAGETGTKNHEERSVPLFPAVEELLNERRARKQPVHDRSRVFEIKTAIHQTYRACDRLDLPRSNQHTMRHVFCSNAIEQGVDFKTIADWVGHKDGGVLVAKTYGHLRQEHSMQQAQKMTFRVAA